MSNSTGVDGGDVTERVRDYHRKTDRLPYPNISKEFLGKIDTSTSYVIEKIVSRLEMDAGGLWRVPCVRLSLNAMCSKKSSIALSNSTRQTHDLAYVEA